MDHSGYVARTSEQAGPEARQRETLLPRVLAALGFCLLLCVLATLVSRQVALDGARTFLISGYRVPVEVDVTDIRPVFLNDPEVSRRKLPPLGLCWDAEVAAGSVHADLTINPWTGSVVSGSVTLQ